VTIICGLPRKGPKTALWRWRRRWREALFLFESRLLDRDVRGKRARRLRRARRRTWRRSRNRRGFDRSARRLGLGRGGGRAGRLRGLLLFNPLFFGRRCLFGLRAFLRRRCRGALALRRRRYLFLFVC